MNHVTRLVAAPALLLLLLTGAAGQTSQRRPAPADALAYIKSQSRENPARKRLDICFSIGEAGEVSKITIQSNQFDAATHLRNNMSREEVAEVINGLVPEEERGAKVREDETGFGRAYGKTTAYQKVTIHLTITCRGGGECGVSYAEIDWGPGPRERARPPRPPR